MEAKALVPVEIQPAKSSLLATAVNAVQVPDQIQRRVSEPPLQELMFRMPLEVGVYAYQPAAVAVVCDGVPIRVVAVKVPGVTGEAVAQVRACA